MNNWTISEESKQLLAELKVLIEKNVRIQPVHRCKYCNSVIEFRAVSGGKSTVTKYCNDWCKEQTRLNVKTGECEICGGPVQSYVWMIGPRKGKSTGKYPKKCQTCKPRRYYKLKNKTK